MGLEDWKTLRTKRKRKTKNCGDLKMLKKGNLLTEHCKSHLRA